jgi:hypothetical protein
MVHKVRCELVIDCTGTVHVVVLGTGTVRYNTQVRYGYHLRTKVRYPPNQTEEGL